MNLSETQIRHFLKRLRNDKTSISVLTQLLEELGASVANHDLFSRALVYKSKKPRTKSNHIGVEIECFSQCSEIELLTEIYNAGLESKIELGDDSSIAGDNYERTYEIRVIDTEKNILGTIKRLYKVLNKLKFKTNETCGLHVHIDCRNRDRNKLFDKFSRFQMLLFNLVDDSRLNNEFCRFSQNGLGHRAAISKSADLPTLEVRLHQGSLDVEKVCNWIKLLIKIANKRTPKQNVKTVSDLRKYIPVDPRLSNYLNKSFRLRIRGVDYDYSA